MTTRVCVVTGTRAEYGLFRPLLRALGEAADFDPVIVATGAHLSPVFGLTYREIEADGLTIAEKVELPLEDDSELGVARATGVGVVRLSEALARIEPDVVMLLGDRFETLAAATAAVLQRMPIAHIHGGEITEGAVDDSIRHAVTKLSLLHFASTEEYRWRVIQMGEEPERVVNVGALGLDAIRTERLLKGDELAEALGGFELGERSALVTFHPVTLEADGGAAEMRELLGGLSRVEGLRVLFTRPNADAGNQVLNVLVDEYVAASGGSAVAFASLGSVRYLSAMSSAGVVVGNSSSGIIEAPALGTPSVDVGDRQRGRVRATSVTDCEPRADAIAAAVERALAPGVREAVRGAENPYGDGHAAERIVAALRERREMLASPRKRFYDRACD